MKINNDELKKIYYGAYRFSETKDGYLQSYQFNEKQTSYFKEVSDFWYERCNACNGKTIEFISEASSITFDYKIIWEGSPDTVELCVDGRIRDVKYIKDIEKEGTISFKIADDNPVLNKEKHITVYLPADSIMVIKNFEIDATYSFVSKNEKVLWLGDSITQGFGTFRSSHIYVNVANRLLNYDILNQGIGGYVYDKNVLMPMEGYKPDKIIVSLGTNQFGTETMKDIVEYYEVLTKLYEGLPILCITPLWRGDVPDSEETLIRFCSELRKIVENYGYIKIVDGFEMVPHMPEYFLDKLHPNPLGAELYGRNLVNEIKRLGF